MSYEDKPPVDELMHYGTPKHSGRYPWGSGDDPHQHSGTFSSRVKTLKQNGLTEKQIADSLGLKIKDLRIRVGVEKDEARMEEVAKAKNLREKGLGLKAIANEMDYKNDSSVRSLLDENAEGRMRAAKNTADFLKKQVDKKGMVDVGIGVELDLNVSRVKMDQALYMLERDGYPVYKRSVSQITNPGKQTHLQVLCKPGTEWQDIYDTSKIKSATDYISHDGGETFDKKFVYPASLNSKRLKINYAEDGGTDKDGVIELRRGVKDIDLGDSHYSQVRIMVDNTHYLKGMAVYSDNMPEGVDVVFNTNKKRGTPVLGPKDNTVLKTIKDDPDNPFGSLIKEGGQSYYTDNSEKKQLSLINKRADEKDWSDWSNKLPSQFLSKQPLVLIDKQLKLAKADKQAEFDEICSLTNPTVKKRLLKSFADDCDAASVHLKAAALPGQKYHVILPVTSMKDSEVYAPNYEQGTQLALIRYPHGGTFEIPILTVNNKQSTAKKLIGNTSSDAICINSKVAERLSGADFDGDTVMCIPTGGKIKIASTPPLKELEGFDPKMAYPAREGMKVMKNTGTEMGKISNLITDMTLRGANEKDLAKAVRHSMVVIDAEKHKLDYKQSYIDNEIARLKNTYQARIDEDGKKHEGASTLISRAKSQVSVTKRQGSPQIDPETGKQTYKEVKDPYYVSKKTGKLTKHTQQSPAMAETDDAFTLSSGHPKENAYANHANSMKALANSARKTMLATHGTPYSASANAAYSEEVKSLNAKLNVALKNAPRERQAQTIANSIVAIKKQDNPDMSKSDVKKAGQMALQQARIKVDAKRMPVTVTDKEWEAIQAGAITPNRLEKILNNADIDKIKELAMPRANKSISTSKVNKISAMNASGYTTEEIAKALGVSSSTVIKYMK